MTFDCEQRRYKSAFVMTSFTAAFVIAVCKLPRVRIGMAIGTVGENHVFICSGFLRVGLVAFFACNMPVFPDKRIFCFTVVKTGHNNMRPSKRIVAFDAILTEFILMRILMARRAVGKFKLLIIRKIFISASVRLFLRVFHQ